MASGKIRFAEEMATKKTQTPVGKENTPRNTYGLQIFLVANLNEKGEPVAPGVIGTGKDGKQYMAPTLMLNQGCIPQGKEACATGTPLLAFAVAEGENGTNARNAVYSADVVKAMVEAAKKSGAVATGPVVKGGKDRAVYGFYAEAVDRRGAFGKDKDGKELWSSGLFIKPDSIKPSTEYKGVDYTKIDLARHVEMTEIGKENDKAAKGAEKANEAEAPAPAVDMSIETPAAPEATAPAPEADFDMSFN